MSKTHGKYPDYKGAALTPAELVCNENNRNLPGANGVTGDGAVGAPPGGKQ
jgi:hypothetical protein